MRTVKGVTEARSSFRNRTIDSNDGAKKESTVSSLSTGMTI